jgi:hypothetical protein
MNSSPVSGSVLLPRVLHPFLDPDSWLHCHGELVETDEHKLAELLDSQQIPARRGIVGTIATDVRAETLAAIGTSPLLAPVKIRKISPALGRN